MRPIENWDKIAPVETGKAQRLPAGGYVCRIMDVQEDVSKNGRSMLKIALDISDGAYAGIFTKRFNQLAESALRSGKDRPKWPCIYYQLTDGEFEGRFKYVINCVEEANPGYRWNWDEKSLKNRIIGGVFREEEFFGENDKKIHVTVKCDHLRTVVGVEEVEPPPRKKAEVPGGFGGGTVASDIPF